MIRTYAVLSALIFVCVSGGALHAQIPDPDRLDELARQEQAEKQRATELAKKRAAIHAELGGLKSNLTKVARETSSITHQNQQLKQRLENLDKDEARINSKIYDDRQSLSRVLAALQRVQSNPPPAMLISPDDAADAATAAHLMAALSADLQARADALKNELTALETVRADIAAEKIKLQKNEEALTSKRTELNILVTQKAKLDSNLSAEQKVIEGRVASLVSEANSLRELIQKFERAARAVTPRLKPKRGETDVPQRVNPQLRANNSAPLGPLSLPSNRRPFSNAKGRLAAPVTGTLSKSYTSARKGITITTAKKAAVASPYIGRIEFAGAFKSYDNVIILNVGEGYFMLLTGIGETYVKTGEVVAKGEPLGLMPFNSESRPNLYIEFRKDGTTINPTPWLGTAFARKG